MKSTIAYINHLQAHYNQGLPVDFSWLKTKSMPRLPIGHVYQCPICPRKFVFGGYFSQHVFLHQIRERRTNYSCSVGTRQVATKRPNPYTKIYSCPHCLSKLSGGIAFTNHLRMHKNKGMFIDYSWLKRKSISRIPIGHVYKCNICQKQAGSGAGLSSHLRFHEYRGQHVDYSWIAWPPNRKRPTERRRIKTIRPKPSTKIYDCPHCRAKFMRGTGFANHLRIHKSKGFIIDNSWMKHESMSRLYPGHVYQCPFCQKQCSTGRGFAAHLRFHGNRGQRANYTWIKWRSQDIKAKAKPKPSTKIDDGPHCSTKSTRSE